MTRREELLALAARVEAAQGADRELDAEIAVAVHGGTIKWLTSNGIMEPEPFIWRPSSNHVGGFMRDHVPAYTASLDAAASLVPKGWAWCVHDVGVASVMRAPLVLKAGAAIPACALTAAALRAMAEATNGS